MKLLRRFLKRQTGEVKFLPQHKSVEIGDSRTVLDVALSGKIPISHTCGGMGSCTTCRVYIIEGEASPRTDLEQELATDRGFAEDERLACQLEARGGLVVKLPYSS